MAAEVLKELNLTKSTFRQNTFRKDVGDLKSVKDWREITFFTATDSPVSIALAALKTQHDPKKGGGWPIYHTIP